MIGVIFLPAAAFPSLALELAGYKDRLFAYPETLSESSGGAYRVVDYRELRDINGRDEIPEKRVSQAYVSLKVRHSETSAGIPSPAGPVKHLLAGTPDGARVITIYLHGQGGSSRQGMNDFTFGGNFNRIKNLMVRNGGLYLSPDFADFGENGEAMIAALIAHYMDRAPDAALFVACGSAGGALCWRLADNKAVAGRLSGLLLLGSMADGSFFRSRAMARRVPLFFGHGSRDSVFPIGKQEGFFRSILEMQPDYPVRFVRFETGTHGTPIRMTDWRETLNWMLSQR